MAVRGLKGIRSKQEEEEEGEAVDDSNLGFPDVNLFCCPCRETEKLPATGKGCAPIRP
jgi:hypothetical protein